MNAPANAVRILVAEDDADDRLLIRNAFEASGMPGKLGFVNDGEELLDYLYRRGKYANGGSTDQPGIILLDLNMPKVDGREALKVIKNDDALKRIPIVVLTTSNAEIDVVRADREAAAVNPADGRVRPNDAALQIDLIRGGHFQQRRAVMTISTGICRRHSRSRARARPPCWYRWCAAGRN